MSDATDEPTLEQRLGLVLRGVQRMADSLGAVEQRLPELASGERLKALSDRVDEYRVRGRAEVGQVAEVASALGQALDVVLRDQQSLAESVRQLRAEIAALGDSAPAAVPVADTAMLDRLAAIEAGVAALRREISGELGQVAQRDDLRRGVDRVLGAVTGAEQAVTGEIRAVDARVGAMADDVRTVRALRDGIDALAQGVDGVRQLASRSATSQQMTEVIRELAVVLNEIESARSQVLRVEQSTTPVAADVVAVGGEVDQLGRRIDQLAEAIEHRLVTTPPGRDGAASLLVAERLRQVSESARQIGNGMLEDLRARRNRRASGQ